MGHADIATTMIYVHHVPQVDAAERRCARPRGSACAVGSAGGLMNEGFHSVYGDLDVGQVTYI